MVSSPKKVVMAACVILIVFTSLLAGCTSNQPAKTLPVTTHVPGASGVPSTVTIKNSTFNPHTLTVKAGTTVTWINEDNTSHIIASDTESPIRTSSSNLDNGATYQFTFNEEGVYGYHSTTHPSMNGTIIVQP